MALINVVTFDIEPKFRTASQQMIDSARFPVGSLDKAMAHIGFQLGRLGNYKSEIFVDHPMEGLTRVTLHCNGEYAASGTVQLINDEWVDKFD